MALCMCNISMLNINALKLNLFMDNSFLIRFLLTSGKESVHCGKYNNCDGRIFGGRKKRGRLEFKKSILEEEICVRWLLE